jgi:hypothetical protein
MSYTFRIAAPAPPPLARLFDAVDRVRSPSMPGLFSDPAPSRDEPWRERTIRFFLIGASTRWTEVTWNEERREVDVVVRALASREDADIAVRIVEEAAAIAGATRVHADVCGELRIDELRVVHDDAWMGQHAESGARTLVALVHDGRGPMEVPGPIRSFHFGPRLLSELTDAGPPDTLHERMIAAIRRTRWVDPEYWPAHAMVAEPPGRPRVTCAVWSGEPMVYPAVEYALMAALRERQEPFVIPTPGVIELAGDRWTWLDERQGTVEGIDDWPRLVDRARAWRVDFDARN